MTTRKSAEELAREAGLERDGDNWFSDSSDPLDASDVKHADLDRLIALVRAEERAIALEEAAQLAGELEYSSAREIEKRINALKDQP